MDISKKFNLKDFALSWKESESKKDFWTIFAIILVSGILKKYINGIIGILLDIFVSLYVQMEFYINRILYNALILLNYKPNKINFSEFLKLIIIIYIGVLIPFWTGVYAIIPLLLLIISLFLLIISEYVLGFVFMIAFLLVIFYNGLRLYLVFPVYLNLEKRTVIDAIKESWLLTRGNVLKVILYELKTIWYTILQVWIYLLAAILVLLLAISSNVNIGNVYTFIGNMFLFLMVTVLLTYISVVALFTRSFVQAGVYHEFVNQPK